MPETDQISDIARELRPIIELPSNISTRVWLKTWDLGILKGSMCTTYNPNRPRPIDIRVTLKQGQTVHILKAVDK